MKKYLLNLVVILNSLITSAQSDFVIDSLIREEITITLQDKKTIKSKLHNKFFLTANYGFGHRTADIENNIPQLERDFQQKLKSGNSFQFKGVIKHNEFFYYGLTYSNFTSSASLNDIIYTEPTGLEGIGNTNQTNTINYFGLVAGFYIDLFSRRDTYCFDLSLGYINYSEKRQFYNMYEATAGDLGVSFDLSYYFGLTKNFKIGPTFSFSGGAIKKYEINGSNGYYSKVKFDENTFLSLYRIDLMIGTYFQL